MTNISLFTQNAFTVISTTGYIITSGALIASGINSNWVNLPSGVGMADGSSAFIQTHGTGIFPGVYFMFASGSPLANNKIYGGVVNVRAGLDRSSGANNLVGTNITAYFAAGSGFPQILGTPKSGSLDSSGLTTVVIGGSGNFWNTPVITTEQADNLGVLLFFNPPEQGSGTVYLDSVSVNINYGPEFDSTFIYINPDNYNEYRR